MSAELTFVEVEALAHGRFGIFDAACPACGPGRTSPANRARKVLRVWRKEPDFATFTCARCGLTGWARGDGARGGVVADEKPANLGASTAPTEGERSAKARKLWRRSLALAGTPGEAYLRWRGYGGALPATLRFLPAWGDHPPALIAAFTIPNEPEPGVLAVDDETVIAIQITRLKADGLGKAGGERAKTSKGPILGMPVVLAAPNDMLGLAIAEGVETGLSLREATGLGVWVACGAPFMPALAARVPEHIDCVTIAAEADRGREGANELANRLRARGIYVELRFLDEQEANAA